MASSQSYIDLTKNHRQDPIESARPYRELLHFPQAWTLRQIQSRDENRTGTGVRNGAKAKIDESRQNWDWDQIRP